MFLHERDHLFEHRHHSQTQKIDLDDPELGAIVLIPLDHRAAGHARWLEGNHLVEAAPCDHHATGVLPQVTWQTLDLFHQLE